MPPPSNISPSSKWKTSSLLLISILSIFNELVPKISVITPNGRFEPGKDICLSITNFHPESWNPGWGVRSIIIGLISFFYDNENTHGAIRTTEKDKIKLAKESIIFNKKNKEYIKLFNDNELEK